MSGGDFVLPKIGGAFVRGDFVQGGFCPGLSLSRSSFYHLCRLFAVRRSVSMPVFKSMVHAFVCSRIDYCNSLLIGLPKSRLAPLQSVLNAAARLIARIPRFSHISTFMTEQLHWLPLSSRIHFKI